MFGLNIGRLGVVGASTGATLEQQIAAMYRSSEQGAWYDPSDWSTLFQDSAGTLPVMAVGQPVGLMLDKRLGLVQEAELVTDSTFDTGIAGWLAGPNTTIAHVGGEIELTATANGIIQADRKISTVVGKTYQITGAGYRKQASGAVSLTVASIADAPGSSASSPLALAGIIFTANSVVTTIRGRAISAVVGDKFAFDNISVRELPGNPTLQATAPARPLNQATPARVVFDAVDDQHTTTFPAALGSNCTVIRSVPDVGASILTGQTIGTTYTNTVTHSGLLIINRALTAGETASATKWANQRAGV